MPSSFRNGNWSWVRSAVLSAVMGPYQDLAFKSLVAGFSWPFIWKIWLTWTADSLTTSVPIRSLASVLPLMPMNEKPVRNYKLLISLEPSRVNQFLLFSERFLETSSLHVATTM